MAELPDLNTTDVGFLAYWNVIDQGGVPSIDPETATSHGRIDNYTLYDNGIQGEFSLTDATNRLAGFRIKSDGWMVAWLDRTNEFYAREDNGYKPGHWDVARNWSSKNSAATLQQNSLAWVINQLQSELDKSTSISFSYDECGLFHYEFPEATTTTCLSRQASSNNVNCGLLYTADTDIKYAVATAVSDHEFDALDSYHSHQHWSFEGTRIAYTTSSQQETESGAIDLIGRGLIPSPDTEYTLSGNGSGDQANGSGMVLTVWG